MTQALHLRSNGEPQPQFLVPRMITEDSTVKGPWLGALGQGWGLDAFLPHKISRQHNGVSPNGARCTNRAGPGTHSESKWN